MTSRTTGRHKECYFCGRNTEQEPSLDPEPVSTDDLPVGEKHTSERFSKYASFHEESDEYGMFGDMEVWVCKGCVEIHDVDV